MLYRIAAILVVILPVYGGLCYSDDARKSKSEESFEAVYPQIAGSFGKIVKIKANLEYVADERNVKDPQDYYRIRVHSVEGKDLKDRVTMECVPFLKYDAERYGFEKLSRTNPEKTHTITGYEKVDMSGLPAGDYPKGVSIPQGHSFLITHRFVILWVE
jgi:hypothetical protein